jgi:anti-sigma regulatory factor (Ser/Thr protein kinase)
LKAEGQVLVLEFPLEHYRFETAGEASSKIKQVVRQLGVNAQTARRISVCAYEAELNAIIHAFGGFMRVRVFPDRTELEVTDEGPGIPDIAAAMREGFSTAPDTIRELGFGAGMGLPNMARSADEFEIKSSKEAGTWIYMLVRH